MTRVISQFLLDKHYHQHRHIWLFFENQRSTYYVVKYLPNKFIKYLILISIYTYSYCDKFSNFRYIKLSYIDVNSFLIITMAKASKNKINSRTDLLNKATRNNLHIPDGESANLTIELANSFQMEQYSIGTNAKFIYDIGNGYFTYIDESIYEITGIPANEIVFSDPNAYFKSILLDEHLESVAELAIKAHLIGKEYQNSDSLFFNIEYNIISKNNYNKRILCQFKTMYYEEDGYPKINMGKIIDITHTKKDGLPCLFIIIDNKLLITELADPVTIIKSKNIIFTNVEIQIIRLISEGYFIKEVADKLNVSISTIYTHRRNIKLKSQLDLNKVITNLKERGII